MGIGGKKPQRQHQKDSGQGFQFNMKGSGLLQKEAFEKTALFSVIRDAVMTNFPAATELDLRNAVGEAFYKRYKNNN
ncbi:hypothetical protein QQF64_018913 [Cirrhinus molitorella]|uniref:Uncharacterized protein n=1 Tax=Cirrhinus molitorella TaxID=172907 RepID=A0ABR3LDZ5_9TELE